jgi:hypothetical protein
MLMYSCAIKQWCISIMRALNQKLRSEIIYEKKWKKNRRYLCFLMIV